MTRYLLDTNVLSELVRHPHGPVAEHVRDGRLPLDHIATLDDDALIKALVAVKGVGRWTAQMFMMFRLGRLDVLPELDLGVQKGVMLAYRLEALPKPKELAHIMIDSKASWVAVPGGKANRRFAEYPDQSIEDWHKTRGLYEK